MVICADKRDECEYWPYCMFTRGCTMKLHYVCGQYLLLWKCVCSPFLLFLLICLILIHPYVSLRDYNVEQKVSPNPFVSLAYNYLACEICFCNHVCRDWVGCQVLSLDHYSCLNWILFSFHVNCHNFNQNPKSPPGCAGLTWMFWMLSSSTSLAAVRMKWTFIPDSVVNTSSSGTLLISETPRPSSKFTNTYKWIQEERPWKSFS